MQVKNMKSARGNSVPNQFIIKDCVILSIRFVGVMFQSYDSNIAFRYCHKGTKHVLLDEECWDYSATTGKYRNQFLGEGIAETRKKIKSGEYKLVNLNL